MQHECVALRGVDHYNHVVRGGPSVWLLNALPGDSVEWRMTALQLPWPFGPVAPATKTALNPRFRRHTCSARERERERERETTDLDRAVPGRRNERVAQQVEGGHRRAVHLNSATGTSQSCMAE